MDIQFYGANCISITTKQARLVVDDNLAEIGGKSITKADDIILFTGPHKPVSSSKLLIDQPGEYEVAGISVYGIAARSHLEEEGTTSATMYKVTVDDLNFLIVGHIYPDLSDSQLETIGMVDVMLVPVGGNGYTLDTIGALKLIKKVEPKVVIPTHYEDKKLQYPVPQRSLEDALKQLSMEVKETTSKFKPKSEDLGEGLTNLVILESN